MKVYVGGLPVRVAEDELRSVLNGCGRVQSVTITRDRASGEARGYAFIKMSDDAEVRTAIRCLDGKEIGGRKLVAFPYPSLINE